MSHYIEVEKNIRIHVTDIGSGMPVIFLHGWPLSSRMFEAQFTLLSEQGFRCIGIDQRGFGKSYAPANGYDYNRLADDVHAVIRYLKLEHAILIGFSVGGAIAMRYMSRHGGYGIRKLALIGAAAPAFTQREHYPYGMTRDEANEQIAAIRRDRPQFLREFGAQFVAGKAGGPGKDISEAMMDWLHQLGLEAAEWATVRTFESLRDEDLHQDMLRIAVPTVIFQGMRDTICPPDFAKALLAGIDGSALVTFEHSGHGILFDEPARFNKELLDFLQQA
jgi:non-heme chloroperoxidase